MAANKSPLTTLDIDALRRQGGDHLRALRLARNLTQSDAADLLGIKMFNFISQLEKGRRRVPPDLYEAYARMLAVDPAEFVKLVMRYNDPTMYKLLFGVEEPALCVRPGNGEARTCGN